MQRARISIRRVSWIPCYTSTSNPKRNLKTRAFQTICLNNFLEGKTLANRTPSIHDQLRGKICIRMSFHHTLCRVISEKSFRHLSRKKLLWSALPCKLSSSFNRLREPRLILLDYSHKTFPLTMHSQREQTPTNTRINYFMFTSFKRNGISRSSPWLSSTNCRHVWRTKPTWQRPAGRGSPSTFLSFWIRLRELSSST